MNYKNQIIKFPQNRVWRSYLGGRVLDHLVGEEDPEDSHYPEDWIGSVTAASNPGTSGPDEGVSRVNLNGEQLLFSELIAQDPGYFLGAEHVTHFGQQPMVLVKFIDSAVRLQLQVHPTAEFAREHLDSDSGKAEAYYILDIRDDVDEAFVYLGFQRPPDRASLKKSIEAQDLETLTGHFDKIRVKPGDVLFIPGGIPHAIGGGIFLVEILEPSDLVVRFEFETAGYTLPESARFMNRGLDFCLDIFDFRAIPEPVVRRDFMFEPQLETDYGEGGQRYHLVGPETTPCFAVKKTVAHSMIEREEETFFTGVVTEGSCVVRTADSAVELDTFDKFFCPAGLGAYTIETKEGAQILECFPPVQDY